MRAISTLHDPQTPGSMGTASHVLAGTGVCA